MTHYKARASTTDGPSSAATLNLSPLLGVPKQQQLEFSNYVYNLQQDLNDESNRNCHLFNCNLVNMDKLLPEEHLKPLRPIEAISCVLRQPLAELLVTGYHLSEMLMHEYLAQTDLFQRLREAKRAQLQEYLLGYEKVVAKPLYMYDRTSGALASFRDNIHTIVQYMTEINLGIIKVLLTQPVACTIDQLDVFFVAPHHPSTKKLNLHALAALSSRRQGDSRRQGSVIAVSDIHSLLLSILNDCEHDRHHRLVMLVVRQNEEDTADDTVYLWRSTSNLTDKRLSEHSELPYLLRSRLEIAPGLGSTDEGVLGWTHHLHSPDCNKMYLSYGEYKSRVFKADVLKRLRLVVESEEETDTKCDEEFAAAFSDLPDTTYAKVGACWSTKARSYRCFDPVWNARKSCRAKHNVYISKECTVDLLAYIDETAEYQTPGQLYYTLDYTTAMQVCDNEAVAIQLLEPATAVHVLGLINTELHLGGQVLYAVIVANTVRSRQKWSIVAYSHISQAFMTAAQLYTAYGVFGVDLPTGSKQKHQNWQRQMNEIVITETLIRQTRWHEIVVLRTLPSPSPSRSTSFHSNENVIDHLGVSNKEFTQLAVDAVQTLKQLVIHKRETWLCIAQFEFRTNANRYHLEKVLPVWIPPLRKYVAITFCYNSASASTFASNVCLDLVDLQNKASLIQSVRKDSWLYQQVLDQTSASLSLTPSSSYQRLSVTPQNSFSSISPQVQQTTPSLQFQQVVGQTPSSLSLMQASSLSLTQSSSYQRLSLTPQNSFSSYQRLSLTPSSSYQRLSVTPQNSFSSSLQVQQSTASLPFQPPPQSNGPQQQQQQQTQLQSQDQNTYSSAVVNLQPVQLQSAIAIAPLSLMNCYGTLTYLAVPVTTDGQGSNNNIGLYLLVPAIEYPVVFFNPASSF